MRFAGKGGEQDGYENADEEITLGEIEDEEFDEKRYTDSILETPLTPDALQKRLLKLFKDARTAEEEQGINILFLAMGFLRWYEDKNSEVWRESPLILLPVELVRNDKTSTYNLKCRDDDIVTNLPLQERLKHDFGISLPEIDDATEWSPSEYLEGVIESISGKERWEVDEDGMQLGFFSFAKLIMLHDLDPENWEEGALSINELIGGLLKDGFEPDSPLFKEDDNLDDVLPPEKIFHVVDADSSQTKVIEEVRSGRNLVVQGPPGTGKSQTITNILAAAAHDNKKVLFVAEKMAALEVVYNRMCKAGLKDLCLELHSRTANKKKFLQELAVTISHGTGVQPSESDTNALKKSRDELNEATKLLHDKVPDRDYSPYSVLASLVELINQEAPAPRFDASALESISASEESKLFEQLKKYIEIVSKHGPGEDNPFFGATKLDLQPTDLKRLKGELEKLSESIKSWIDFLQNMEGQLGLEPTTPTLSSANDCKSIYEKLKDAPEKFLEFFEVVQEKEGDKFFSDALLAGRDWVQHKEKLSEIVIDSVWDQDLNRLRPALAKATGSWVSRVFGKYRSASNELATYLKNEIPKSPKNRLQILEDIIEGCGKKKALDDESEYLKGPLKELWRGDRTPFPQIYAVSSWLEETTKDFPKLTSDNLKNLIVNDVAASFDPADFDNKKKDLEDVLQQVQDRLGLDRSGEDFESLPLTGLKNRVDAMSNDLYEKYSIWKQYQSSRESLTKVETLLKMLDQGNLDLDAAESELKYALSEVRWKHAREVLPDLKKLESLDRHDLVRTFKQQEKSRVSEVQKLIRDNHLSQIPQGAAGEMGIIRGEIAKKRNHRPIRQLMRRASGVIQKIKPIFLMSPISVAQYLPPGKVKFDILVIDEASQVRPEDALGSIARAKQIIVVGDQKQLPPTSFFSRITSDDDSFTDEDEGEEGQVAVQATEMESVLSLCEARGLNQSMLEWHYRSRDPSLIKVSNVEFYGNRLKLPPCPTQADEDFGLKLVQVPGVYSSRARGGGRAATNRIEAEHLVSRVRELAVTRPQFSVGVVTFSKAQADMVTEVMEFRRREDDILDSFLREGKSENLFVKNIENVQGDERDIILISVGYGPHEANGRLSSMSFGPINSDGGERRLNVLFSRSRVACEVFISFNPSDMTISPTTKEGPVALKKFLDFAETGILTETYSSQGGADSAFEEDVASVTQGLGYKVEHQVGTAGFKIDLGVKDPNNASHYILAIECDGATYHSALWARERDRLRQEILEEFGWHFHRIWSTDWFYKREHEVQRLKTAIEKARSRNVTASMKGANNAPAVVSNETPQEPTQPIVLDETPINLPEYTRAEIFADAHYEPHERPVDQVCQIVVYVVKVEGPIHTSEIGRRYIEGHGKSRTGRKINERVAAGLAAAKKSGALVKKGEFWATKDQFENVPVRNRSNQSLPTTSPENIPPDEIIACAELIKKECGTIELDELVRVIAKTLGFKRAGPDFQAVVKKILT